MATVSVIFGPAGSYNRPRPTPVIRPRVHEILTSGITSVATTAASQGADGYEEFVQITSTGNIRIAFGENPVATGSDIVVLANTTRDFAISPGQRIAAIDG